jgi:hypothetical protein
MEEERLVEGGPLAQRLGTARGTDPDPVRCLAVRIDPPRGPTVRIEVRCLTVRIDPG